MDAGAIVAILFVAVIISSINKTPEKAVPPLASPPSIQQPLPEETPAIPFSYEGNINPYFEERAGQDTQQVISDFIIYHTRKQKNVSMDTAKEISQAIYKYCKEYNVNPRLMTAFIARESKFNRFAYSKSGAMGLGQLLPSTARGLGVDDAYDINQNVMGSTKYVSRLLKAWENDPEQIPKAIASYLEGPNAVKRRGGMRESSRAYVKDVINLCQTI